ncbi:MAG: hypothetical protein MJE68_03865 [Proteobacteria bacterium]|nr:hypothetical protein [Pseudomonadota bacterium]
MAQPNRPTDTQHCVRMCVGNGLRPQIWSSFTKRFGIAKIAEFYGSTEGNVGLLNPFNRVGSCGTISVVLPMFNPVVLIKVRNITLMLLQYYWIESEYYITNCLAGYFISARDPSLGSVD